MIRQMRYYIAVVEAGSFSEAAEVCHISQSAISQQIKALEDELQVELLERRGRRFAVTPAGQWFYQRAKRHVAEMDSTIREVRRIGTGEHQQLRIGVLTGFSGKIIQNAVSDFVASHPYVQMSLVSGTHEDIFQKIMAGQLDMVVNDQRRALADHFVNEELGDQPLYAMLRQDAPLARQSSATMEDLREELCIIVSSPEQRNNEASYWRDVMTVQGDLLFVDSVEDACMNAVAGVGWFPCDHDMATKAGTVLLPLMRGEVPVTRKMFAFWLEARDSSLQWEFSAQLSQYFL